MTQAASLGAMSPRGHGVQHPMDLADKLVVVAVVLVLLVFPFINILHFALPIWDISGKSGWLVGATAILTLAYILVVRPWGSKDLWEQRYIIAAATVVCGIILLRSAVYGESIVPINFRFIVISVISVSISEVLVRRGALGTLTFALAAQGIFVSLLIYSNMNYFPSVSIASDERGLTGIIVNGERTRSMLINAAIGSNAIIASMFVLVAWASSKRRHPEAVTWHIAFWTTLLFMTYCASLTGTRYPMFAAVVVLLLAFWLLPKRLSLIGIAVAIPLLSGISLIIDTTIALMGQMDLLNALGPTPSTDAFPNLRIGQDSGGRVEKLLLAFSMITNGPMNALIGASLVEISTTRTPGLVVFSDNSFATILLEAGIPAGLFLIAAGAFYLGRYTRNLLGAVFGAYVFGALCVTNGILWDSWFSAVFFIFPVIYALGGSPFGTPRDLEQPRASTELSGA